MLHDVDESDEPADLPRSGDDLVHWVQVLLKTSGDDGDDDLKGLVHQASVRADVVVSLIEELKNRGHRAYKNLDITRVRSKAERTVPKEGVPPEILHLLPLSKDNEMLDKIQIQKAATPIPLSLIHI